VQAPVLKCRYKAKPTILRKLVGRITNALRDAPEPPLLTSQIADAISVGLDLDTAKRLELTKLVIQRLRNMRRDGCVQHAGKVGVRKLW
jgi:hypothetical protein